MDENNIQKVIDKFNDEFDSEMVESRDSRTGRAIMTDSFDEVHDWLAEYGFDVSIRFDMEYDDGDVSGTPVEFEVPGPVATEDFDFTTKTFAEGKQS